MSADSHGEGHAFYLVTTFGVHNSQKTLIAVLQETRTNPHAVVDGHDADHHDAEDGADDDDCSPGRDDTLDLERQGDAHAPLEGDEGRDETAGPGTQHVGPAWTLEKSDTVDTEWTQSGQR